MSPRQVIIIDADAGILSVPGAAVHSISVAFEDARSANCSRKITDMIQMACDELDDHIEDILSSPTDEDSSASNGDNPVDVQEDDNATSDDSKSVETLFPINESTMVDDDDHNITTASIQSPSNESGAGSSSCINTTVIGERVEVFCPADIA